MFTLSWFFFIFPDSIVHTPLSVFSMTEMNPLSCLYCQLQKCSLSPGCVFSDSNVCFHLGIISVTIMFILFCFFLSDRTELQTVRNLGTWFLPFLPHPPLNGSLPYLLFLQLCDSNVHTRIVFIFSASTVFPLLAVFSGTVMFQLSCLYFQ